MKEYKICDVCVMDTTDPDIKFYGARGCSNCCTAKRTYILTKRRSKNLKELVRRIRQNGANKKYDCLIGVSGGVDSSYVAYVVKKLHLRPLAVHVDNGWNSELAVRNIQNVLEKLNIDLYTYVIDWEEFKDIQKAFLRASTPDCEIPTDHAISAVLYDVARKKHIKYIIDGWNVETETILPKKWSHGHRDWKYIREVHKKFGEKKIKTFPHYGRVKKLIYEKVFRIEKVSVLNYVPYNKEHVKAKMIKELGWRDYGNKHEESFYTKFYQNYFLPEKFGYDKRRMHLSSLIVSGQITREEALEVLKDNNYTKEEAERDIKYFCEKMQMSKTEFSEIMKAPKHTYWDYPNYENDLIHKIFGI